MKVHELKVAAAKKKTRVGRGIAAGQGKTAGRGTKGQNSRSGGGVRVGFEGGQNPLAKRLPKKRGFKALNHQDYQLISLSGLNQFKAGSTVAAEQLKEARLIKSLDQPVKLLANGELTVKLTIRIEAASLAARQAVTKAGGKLELTKTAK